MKICTKCGLEKPSKDFYRDKRSNRGYRSECMICSKSYLNKIQTKERLKNHDKNKNDKMTEKSKKDGTQESKENDEKESKETESNKKERMKHEKDKNEKFDSTKNKENNDEKKKSISEEFIVYDDPADKLKK